MSAAAWDHTGFHHLAVYQEVPWCRCGINFRSFRELANHLVRVDVGGSALQQEENP